MPPKRKKPAPPTQKPRKSPRLSTVLSRYTPQTLHRRKRRKKSNDKAIELPPEVQRRVALFLSPQEAIHLSRTCRSWHDGLALKTLTMRLKPRQMSGGGRHSPTYFAFCLPMLPQYVHSAELSGRIVQDGMAHGDIYVVQGTVLEAQVAESPETLNPVYTTPAYFVWTSFSVTLEGQHREYSVWYRARGVGFVCISLDRLQWKMLVHDDEITPNIFHQLSEINVWGDSSRAQMLLALVSQRDTESLLDLQSQGFDTDDESLDVLEHLLRLDESQWRETAREGKVVVRQREESHQWETWNLALLWS